MSNDYDIDKDKLIKEFLYYCVLTLDECANIVGVLPCTFEGQCYYTWKTCPAIHRSEYVNQKREYKFQSKDASPIQSFEIILPYLTDDVETMASEIVPEDSWTVDARWELTFGEDDNPPPPNHDKGEGKYNTSRAGTFWKNLIRRNDIMTRKFEIYEGEPHYALNEFKSKFKGIVENIEDLPSGSIRLTASDNMKKFEKSTIPNPISSDNVTTADINNSTTTIPVSDGTEFKLLSNGYISYIKIVDDVNGHEYLEMTNITNNDLTVVRSNLFQTGGDTTCYEHPAGTEMIQVGVFTDPADTGVDTDEGLNLVDCIQTAGLGWEGFDSTDEWDGATLDNERDFWLPGYKYRQIIEEPIETKKFVAKLRELGMFDLWQNTEDFKITGKTLHPVFKDEAEYHEINSMDNIVEDTMDVDRNWEQQFTHVLVYYYPIDVWNADSSEKAEDYSKRLIYVDTDASAEFGPNKEKWKTVYAWGVFREDEALEFASRFLRRNSLPPAKFDYSLERKDNDILMGHQVGALCDRFVDEEGNETLVFFQVIAKNESRDGEIMLKTLELAFAKNYFLWGPDNQTDDYLNRSTAELEAGYGWWSDDDGFMSDGLEGWSWW